MPLRLITNRDRSGPTVPSAGEGAGGTAPPPDQHPDEHPDQPRHPDQSPDRQPEQHPEHQPAQQSQQPQDAPPVARPDPLAGTQKAEHLLEGMFPDRAPPGSAQHLELLGSAYSLLDEIRRTSAAVRERFELERRSRAAFHDELNEALSEQVGLRESIEVERAGRLVAAERVAELEARLATEQAERSQAVEAYERERLAASERIAALEVGLVAERAGWDRERLAAGERIAELEAELAAERARRLDASEQPDMARREGAGAVAGLAEVARLREVERELARERERWLDERRGLEAQLSEQAEARALLQRAYDQACADRDRLQSTKESLESWLESMVERHAPQARPVTAPGTQPAAPGPAAPRAGGSVSQDDVPAGPPVSEEELARAQQALVGNEEARRRDLAELRAHLGTVHAALLVDDIEHLHGCVAAEEIPGLIEELHRLDWLARHRIAMGEEDGHPTLGEVGVPVTHFLFGVLPDYLLDATETLLRASEAPWHGDAVGTVEGQFEKLVKLHDVLNDFFGHALEEGALVLPSSLTGVADEWRTPDSEACVDPLSALDALYHAVDRHYADDEREALALMDRIVAVNVWCDVDGVRLEPCTQRKLLYLMLRLVNSARVVLADAFALIQEIQRAAR